MTMMFNLSLLLTLVLPLCTLAAPISSLFERHGLVVRNPEADQGHNLTKRFDDTRWTFYNVETGNEVFCGGFHGNNDAIVALSGANMNQGLCGKTISMTFGGTTRTATIVDMCPGCPPNGLDLAQNFFSQFASNDVGVISGTWNFVDGGSPPPPPPPPPPPSPPPAPPAPAPAPASPAPDATPSPSDPPPASPQDAPPAAPSPSDPVPPPPPPAPTTTPSDPSPSPAAADPSPEEPCEPDTPDAPADPASVSLPPNDPQPIPPPESPTPSPPPVSPSSSDLYPSSVSPIPEIPATPLTPTPSPSVTSASSSDSTSSSTSSASPTPVALGSIKTSGSRSVLAGPKELTALVGALLVVFCCL